MVIQADTRVYVLVHRDLDVTVTILGVFAELADANEICMRHASESGVPLVRQSPTDGPDRQHLGPVEPMRWDTAEGVSCWVEEHPLTPRKVVLPSPAAKRATSGHLESTKAPVPKRQNSSLYNNSEEPDDVVLEKDDDYYD